MGNVLTGISKDNTGFTIFENDQVLTADQLNDLFNYLDVQTRLTRTKAIGVGIICGLEIGLIENKRMVLSKGAAITTDGDLLHLDADQEFNQFSLFEDVNAKYPYFRALNEELIPLYELRNNETDNVSPGNDISVFEEISGTLLKDYAGILYVEDYQNDPDVCTGTDCDNKGREAVKNLKVLLVHKSNMAILLQSLPATNKDYFGLEDIRIPRVILRPGITTYAGLNAAFNEAFIIKDDIKSKLQKAYQACKPIVEDEFEGGDPTSEWNALLDEHFKIASSIYAQYLYNFIRDLSYAYNELRETLFSEDTICCPDVDIFPKHVLLGLVKTAAIRDPVPPLSPPVAPLFTGIRNFNSRLTSLIRFDISSLIRRFHPVHIDPEFRHRFYESPVLNKKDEDSRQTRFGFMRIHAMIKNFKVPVAEELQSIDQALKITPGFNEDKPLGSRSLPFYYRYNADLPINLYWNYEANIRKKENQIYSYSSGRYASDPAVLTPLLFNILPFDFFRIEGHIGFQRAVVERTLTNLILQNNLPINIQSVQVELKAETIPTRPWFFPQVHLYENFVRNTLHDHMNQVELFHANLAQDVSDADEAKPAIVASINSFANAKNKVMTDKPISDPEFDVASYKADVQNVITAASDVKKLTQKFTFSNTAPPHDFIINTDVLHKADLLDDLLKQHIDHKKEGLMLTNFLSQNPGLEHAGGVLRGGTFVLVYTSDDDKVVADFMLPYASIDKDIVPNPPVIKPLPLPEKPKFDLPKLFEIEPHYIKEFDKRIAPYARVTDIDSKVDSKFNDVEAKFDLKLAVRDTKIADLEPRFNSFDERLKSNTTLFDKVFTAGLNTRPNTGLVVGGKDLSAQVKDLQAKQRELEALSPEDPGRQAKEAEFLNSAEALTNELNKPEITNDANNAIVVKSVLSDIHSGTNLIRNDALKSKATDITNVANTINKGFGVIR
ncbi:hypothetical protein [Rubrolithibacter danxiaensis]|uniref:hypothetical protein n=1 Tax=Rubrolithibacter danxiaensis TaxID=3390805 RepID=UPI003BF8FFF4